MQPDFTKSGELKVVAGRSAEQLFEFVKQEVSQEMLKQGRFADVYKDEKGREVTVSWCYY